jgi:hypothetical protein
VVTPKQSLSELGRAMEHSWHSLGRFFAANRKIIGTLLLIVVIPDWIAREQFWYRVATYVWPILRHFYDAWYGRLLIVVAGLALIFFPWDRFRFKKQYDLTTLKGRSLKLRDDMLAFLNSTPNNEKFGSTDVIPGTHIERSVGHSLRVMRLQQGYDSHFADAVERVVREFGERGIRHPDLEQTLSPNRQLNNDDFYLLVMAYLAEMAALPEANA